MKRIYQTPETELVTIRVEQMIAISGPVEDGFRTDDPDIPETYETSGNLSRRRRDIWEDEEEEEEEF